MTAFVILILKILKTVLSICFVLGTIALVHEFGHYITAKLTGIWVIEFAIGFGNRLLKRKWGETIYSVRPFPLGGFVRLAGMDAEEDEEEKTDKSNTDTAAAENQVAVEGAQKQAEPAKEEDDEPKIDPNDPRGFPIKPRWVKILVLAAGSIMNLVWAVILFIIIHAVSGGPLSNIAVLDAPKDKPAYLAGVRAGDVITAIDGIKIEDWSDGVKIIQQSTGKTIVLDVARDHATPLGAFGGGLLQGDSAINRGSYEIHNRETIKIPVVPAAKPESQGAFSVFLNSIFKTALSIFGQQPANGQIGISLAPNNYDFKALPFFKAVEKGIDSSFGIIIQTIGGLMKMFFRETQADVAGPVKIMQMIKDQSNKGIFELLYLTAILSINIGLINMLPLPVLDGGRIVFVLLEAVFSLLAMLTGIKLAITPKLEENIHFVGLLFLLTVLVLVTYSDIKSFF